MSVWGSTIGGLNDAGTRGAEQWSSISWQRLHSTKTLSCFGVIGEEKKKGVAEDDLNQCGDKYVLFVISLFFVCRFYAASVTSRQRPQSTRLLSHQAENAFAMEKGSRGDIVENTAGYSARGPGLPPTHGATVRLYCNTAQRGLRFSLSEDKPALKCSNLGIGTTAGFQFQLNVVCIDEYNSHDASPY